MNDGDMVTSASLLDVSEDEDIEIQK